MFTIISNFLLDKMNDQDGMCVTKTRLFLEPVRSKCSFYNKWVKKGLHVRIQSYAPNEDL